MQNIQDKGRRTHAEKHSSFQYSEHSCKEVADSSIYQMVLAWYSRNEIYSLKGPQIRGVEVSSFFFWEFLKLILQFSKPKNDLIKVFGPCLFLENLNVLTQSQEKALVTKFQSFISMGITQWGKVWCSEPKTLVLKKQKQKQNLPIEIPYTKASWAPVRS